MNLDKQRIIQLVIFFSIVVWSLIKPYSYLTWFLEVIPVIATFILLAVLYKRFRFTNINYWLILINYIILLIGAHYTYERVPLFNFLKEFFELSRNNYDKVGHLAQGFIPALAVRELLLRTSPLRPGKWLFFIVVSVALAFSAFYELLEWWSALSMGDASNDFLGTQGDVWDTQSDMFFALIGAILGQILFRNYIDKKVSDIQNSQ